MPTSAFDSDVVNMVDDAVCANLNNRLDTITKKFHDTIRTMEDRLDKKYFGYTFDIPTMLKNL